jgi:uncharacterized protein YndB with AHSA1/START domain
MKYVALAVAVLVAPAPAAAGVVSSSSHGFEVRHTVSLAVPPRVVFAAFSRMGAWWDPDHTYSGSSANLGLDLVPGGCLCERFPKGGGVEHMRVAFVDPGKRIVLTGSLGPLLYEATTGVMDVQVKPVAGGSQLILNYRAAGFANGASLPLAATVDEVLGAQLKRFRAYAIKQPKT